MPGRPVPGGWPVCQALLVQMEYLAEAGKMGGREREGTLEVQV